MELGLARCSRTPKAGRWRQSRGSRRPRKYRGPCPVRAVRSQADKFQKLVSISTGITTPASFVIGARQRFVNFTRLPDCNGLALNRLRLASSVRDSGRKGEKLHHELGQNRRQLETAQGKSPRKV